jgi:acylphosphatase
MDRIAVRLIVQGRVQGVGYRWWTRTQARRLELDGWVRNRRDGSVEILAIGPAAQIARLAELCRHGPAAAAVTSVERLEAEQQDIVGFEERPTP